MNVTMGFKRQKFYDSNVKGEIISPTDQPRLMEQPLVEWSALFFKI